MSLMEVKIRVATIEDIHQLSVLVGDYHAFESIELSLDQRNLALELLLQDLTLGFVMVATIDEQLIAYLAVCYGYSIELAGRDAFMDEFFVCEDKRGMGIGSKLLESAIKGAKNNQAKALHLEVAKTNNSAKSFYQKKGFSSRDNFRLMSYHL